MNTQEILIITIITVISVLIFMYFEARRLKVELLDHTFGSSCLKIIFLSDIHINLLLVPIIKIANEISKQKPDLIIFGGDYIDNPKHLKKFLNFIDTLLIDCPMYMCYGNHDLETFKKHNGFKEVFDNEMISRNIKVLFNSSETFIKNDQNFHIIGLDDVNVGSPDIEAATKDINEIKGIKIGLTHNPDLVLQLSENKLDYLFCGHFHGGQIWMPFRFEFVLLRKDQLCKAGIIKGMHKLNGIIVYISRGLGCVLFPLRFFSRPELTVIKMPAD
jgi:predicted MPP superfamily phosphohydrolase